MLTAGRLRVPQLRPKPPALRVPSPSGASSSSSLASPTSRDSGEDDDYDPIALPANSHDLPTERDDVLTVPRPATVTASLHASITADAVALLHEHVLPRMRAALPATDRAVLAKCEIRYIIWLRLAASVDAATRSLLLPPWDVAVLWFAHMAARPLSYAADARRFGVPLDMPFPVHRLAHLASLGPGYVDADSARLWSRFAPSEPFTLAALPTELPFVCPRCATTCVVPAHHYVRVRFGADTVECGRCLRGGLNVALWSAMLLLNDLKRLTSNPHAELKRVDDPHVLQTFRDIRLDLQLRGRLRASPNRYWTDIYAALRAVAPDHALTLVEAYGNVVTDLSTDAVECAVQFLEMDRTLADLTPTMDPTSAIDDYFRLLVLQAGTTKQLCASLAAWHAHLVHVAHDPRAFLAYCDAHLGRPCSLVVPQVPRAYARTRRLWNARFPDPWDPFADPAKVRALLAKTRAARAARFTVKLLAAPLRAVAAGAAMVAAATPGDAANRSHAEQQQESQDHGTGPESVNTPSHNSMSRSAIETPATMSWRSSRQTCMESSSVLPPMPLSATTTTHSNRGLPSPPSSVHATASLLSSPAAIEPPAIVVVVPEGTVEGVRERAPSHDHEFSEVASSAVAALP